MKLEKGAVTLEFDGETITFNIFNSMKFPKEKEICYQIQTLESTIGETSFDVCKSDNDLLQSLKVIASISGDKEEDLHPTLASCLVHSPKWTAEKFNAKNLEFPETL